MSEGVLFLCNELQRNNKFKHERKYFGSGFSNRDNWIVLKYSIKSTGNCYN